MVRRVFAVVAYFAFLSSFSYFALFCAGIIVPRSIDSGPVAPLAAGLPIDLALVAFFGGVHSLLARGWVKALLRPLVSPAANRSFYVLVASVQVGLICLLWQPLPGVVWRATGVAALVLAALQAVGWGLALCSTFLIDHLELFGLRQGLGLSPANPKLRTPFAYQLVRHPLYLGMIVAMWAAPVLSTGHLVLAACLTAYVLIGIRHEERDLVRHFGDAYRAYQERVPMLLPIPRR